MYLTPRYTYDSVPGGYFQRFSELLNANVYPGDGVAFGGVSYNASEEYLASTQKRSVGMHPCDHYKITRNVFPGFSRGLTNWCNVSDHTQGKQQETKPFSTYITWKEKGVLVAGGIGPSTRYGPAESPLLGLPGLWAGVGGGGVTAMTDVNGLTGYAFQRILPGIRPAENISLINSIIELKDFRSLPKSINNLRRLIRNVNGKFGILTRLRKFPKHTLRELLRTGSDAYLQAEFNVLPLMSDLVGLYTAISDVRSQLNKLKANAGKLQKRHYRRSLSDSYPNSSERYTTPFTGVALTNYMLVSDFQYARSCYYSRREFNLTLEYSYTLPSWVGDDGIAFAFLDRVGVSLNPRIIWNAIPWSFVIDWVVGVGQWLDQFKTRAVEPQLYIRGVCASINIARIITTSCGFGAADPCAVITERAYKRWIPGNLADSLRASGLTSKEVSLAAALALTR